MRLARPLSPAISLPRRAHAHNTRRHGAHATPPSCLYTPHPVLTPLGLCWRLPSGVLTSDLCGPPPREQAGLQGPTYVEYSTVHV